MPFAYNTARHRRTPSIKVAAYAYKDKYRSCVRADETPAHRDYYDLAPDQRTQSNHYHADGTKVRRDSYHLDATIAHTERYDRATNKMTQVLTHDPMRPELPPFYYLLTAIVVIQILDLLAFRDHAYSASTSEFLTESSWTDLPPAPAKKTPTAGL